MSMDVSDGGASLADAAASVAVQLNALLAAGVLPESLEGVDSQRPHLFNLRLERRAFVLAGAVDEGSHSDGLCRRRHARSYGITTRGGIPWS